MTWDNTDINKTIEKLQIFLEQVAIIVEMLIKVVPLHLNWPICEYAKWSMNHLKWSCFILF